MLASSLAFCLLGLTDARGQSQTFAVAPAADETLVDNTKRTTPRHPAGTPKGNIYKLDLGDRLQIRIYGREDIPTEYLVNDEGQINIPTVGIFDAVSKTAKELEQAVVQALELSLQRTIYVAVEILERRPIFVTGLVARPDTYAYRLGMRVVHATALAGGTSFAALAPFLPVEALRAAAAARASEEELVRLIASRARLIADRNGTAEIAVPRALLEMVGKKRAAELIKGQQEILDRERETLARRKTALEATIKELNTEAAAFRKELLNITRQRQLRQSNMDRVKSLTKKGLTTQFRLAEFQFRLASVDRDAQTAITNLARSRQTLHATERDLDLLLLERRIEIDKQLQHTDQEIAKTRAEIEGSKKIVRHVTSMPSKVLMGDRAPEYRYEIMRNASDGQMDIILANDSTPLQPGDVLRVSVLEPK